MANVLGFIVRILVGAISLIVAFLVLDAIHDRNTEIVVACLGLTYCFTFVISRRWQYYGLNAVSLFGMTVSWVNAEPHDQGTRAAASTCRPKRSFVVVSIVDRVARRVGLRLSPADLAARPRLGAPRRAAPPGGSTFTLGCKAGWGAL